MGDVHNLFEYAMKGWWDKVVTTYENNPMAQEAKITRNEDTALHIAVADGRTPTVLQLVRCLKENASKILRMQNERGDTPLHLAAALGDVEMCECIGSIDRELISVHNIEKETPLFYAAHHGKKKAFFCLHHLRQKDPLDENYYIPCRRKNGDTILHTAIFREHFSLALEIIHQYPDLVNFINENGLSPLHVLASKPNAFQSSSRLSMFDRIIYHCSIVDKLEEAADHEANTKYKKVKSHPKYPENYQTCMNFFEPLRKLYDFLANLLWNKSTALSDVENITPREGTAGPSSSVEKPESNVAIETLPNAKVSAPDSGGNQSEKEDDQEAQLFPPNYATQVLLFKVFMKTLLIIMGLGIGRIQKIKEKKLKHKWAVRVMNQLVKPASFYKYDHNGKKPKISPLEKKEFQVPESPLAETQINDKESSTGELEKRNEAQRSKVIGKKETPILTAAKVGVTEIVEKILDTYPVAIQDLDSNRKNVVLLAVEHRQPHVYNLLRRREILKESVFHQVDDQGNSAMHLAASFGEHRPWLIPGAALQMQWEYKWYKFVKKSMGRNFFISHNDKGQTPKEVFQDTHQDLVKSGSEWLTKTSESCSVVAALNATVAFATASTVPGGLNEENGKPILEHNAGFKVFAIASLLTLCFSVTALVFFLTILTSRFQEKDFIKSLPRRLLMGLTSLFASIASILVSFCAGHFFVLKDEVRFMAYPIYVVMCLPVTFFALAQLHLYFDLIWAIFIKVPQRSCKVFPH